MRSVPLYHGKRRSGAGRFVDLCQDAAAKGRNPALRGKPQTIDQLKSDNLFKEMLRDSDIKVALISGAPCDVGKATKVWPQFNFPPCEYVAV